MTDKVAAPQSTDTPTKRRLSLRLSGDPLSISDKKPRFELTNHGPRSHDTSEYNPEVEPPGTATSSRFARRSTSSFSSPTSSNGEDDGHNEHRRADDRQQRQGFDPGHQRRPSYPPTWVTADDRRATAPSGSSSRSSGRPQSYHPTPSASAAASRHSSPPPSFNLSSGQPLVNPPPKTQAAFVGKLYSMLEDDEIVKTGLIYWSAEGSTFTCPNPTGFSKSVLPRFFKHNNWQSFVRQLNMYSFNKVNDIYSTSTDPQAWEFRHSLFRKGEPHLLASIKRKSSRPSTHEGVQPLSPTDELPDIPKPVAGWMRDAGQPPFRLNSPPLGQPIVFPYAGSNEETRPASRGGMWESRQPGPPLNSQPRMPPPEPQGQQMVPRFHPDANRPPLSAQRFLPPNFPESPFYSRPPSADALSGQVVALEERLHKLAEVLNNDRIEHVRNNIDFTSYILQMVGWAANAQPSPEMKALQDTLSRSNADMRQKYEALMASDALAIMARGMPTALDRERERELDRERDREDRTSRLPFEHPPSYPPRSIHATLPNLRLLPNNGISRGQTPRTSPLNREFGDISTIPRPPSGMSHRPSTGPDFHPQANHTTLPMPINIARSSNPNVSYVQPPPPLTTIVSGTQRNGGLVNGNSKDNGLPKPLERTEDRERDRNWKISAENSGVSRGPDEIVREESKPESHQDLNRPKAGLKNLLN